MIRSTLLTDFNDVIEHGFGNKDNGEFFDNLRNKIFMTQIHSNRVSIIEDDTEPGECDSLVSIESEIALCVKTADCIPVLMFDPAGLVIAAVHCGRKGLEKHIITNTISIMKENFNSNPEDIRVVLGPAISKDHYEVDSETYDMFVSNTYGSQTGCWLDLKHSAVRESVNAGILKKHIDNMEICTFEDNRFNSYRRDKTNQRQISYIALKNIG